MSLSNMVSPTEQGRKMPEQNTRLDTSRDKIYPISPFVQSKQKVRKTFDHSFSKMDISALTHCPTKHFVNDLISHQNATHPPRVNKGIQTVFLQNNLRGLGDKCENNLTNQYVNFPIFMRQLKGVVSHSNQLCVCRNYRTQSEAFKTLANHL